MCSRFSPPVGGSGAHGHVSPVVVTAARDVADRHGPRGGRPLKLGAVSAEPKKTADTAVLYMHKTSTGVKPEARLLARAPELPADAFEHDGEITDRDG